MVEPAQRSTLLLSVSSARDEVMGKADRRLVPDLVVGSGSHEIARQEPGRRPMPNTIHLFSSFKNHGSRESKLMAAIQSEAHLN